MSPVYSEALTYRPIFEIGKGRGWKVRPQKKLAKKDRQLGRNKTVDFVFQSSKEDIGIFLEVKFIRKTAKHCVQVTKDVHKLALLNSADISEMRPPQYVFKYLLLIGTENDISERVKKFSRIFKAPDLGRISRVEDRRLLDQIKAIFGTSENARVGNSDGWAFSGHGGDNWKYWAVLLKEREWWTKLAKLKGDLVEEEDDEGAVDDDLANLDRDAEEED
jgi:hypothetical protein